MHRASKMRETERRAKISGMDAGVDYTSDPVSSCSGPALAVPGTCLGEDHLPLSPRFR